MHSNGNLAEKLKLIYFKDPRGDGGGGASVGAMFGVKRTWPRGGTVVRFVPTKCSARMMVFFGLLLPLFEGAFCSPAGWCRQLIDGSTGERAVQKKVWVRVCVGIFRKLCLTGPRGVPHRSSWK